MAKADENPIHGGCDTIALQHLFSMGRASCQEVAEATGYTRRAVDNSLRKAKAHGLADRDETDMPMRYQLTEAGREFVMTLQQQPAEPEPTEEAVPAAEERPVEPKPRKKRPAPSASPGREQGMQGRIEEILIAKGPRTASQLTRTLRMPNRQYVYKPLRVLLEAGRIRINGKKGKEKMYEAAGKAAGASNGESGLHELAQELVEVAGRIDDLKGELDELRDRKEEILAKLRED